MDLPPLTSGVLVQRYKRFLADIRLDDGRLVTAHCPNSGSMLSCKDPGSPVLLSEHTDAKRKYRYTWEMIRVQDIWVGINTMVPNRIVGEALESGQIPELTGYPHMRREVAYGQNSRIDWLIENDHQRCYVEVKNVTLAVNGIAMFPDAVTARGAKHLRELTEMVRYGHRSVMFYMVQRSDADFFRPAGHIDPYYAASLQEAAQAGVEILVYQAKVSPERISLSRPLSWEI